MYRVIHAKPVYKEENYDNNFLFCERVFYLAGSSMSGGML